MISEFKGKFDFLSNFYPCKIHYMGLDFLSTEAAFQAAKCGKEEDRTLFVDLDPSQAKKLGRKIFLRDDWEEQKLSVMQDLLAIKFAIPALKEKLLATGDEMLEEGNWWQDVFWGVCNGKGRNWLGKLLMMLRQKLKEEGNE